jgi:hypothetical protein
MQNYDPERNFQKFGFLQKVHVYRHWKGSVRCTDEICAASKVKQKWQNVSLFMLNAIRAQSLLGYSTVRLRPLQCFREAYGIRLEPAAKIWFRHKPYMIAVILPAYHFCQQYTKGYPTFCCQG